MDWLEALSDYADSGRRRFDERMSEIEDLPRGQYLKQKYELTDEPAVAIYRSTSPPASAAEIDKIGPVPGELQALLEWSDGLSDSAMFRKSLEIQLFGVKSILEYQRVAREVVDRDDFHTALVHQDAEDVPTDASESVDRDAHVSRAFRCF